MLPFRDRSDHLVPVTGLDMWLAIDVTPGWMAELIWSWSAQVIEGHELCRAWKAEEADVKAPETAEPANLAPKQGSKGLQSS